MGAAPQQEGLQLRFDAARLATGVQLRYAEQGDPAGPAVILLHGYTDSWFSWSAVLPLLAPDLHVFALDQRGFGHSERPEQGYALDDFAADVLAFMDAAGLPTATLVGHSMGSWIAQRAASIAPHRFERLVLVGSSATRIAAVEELNAAVQELSDPFPADFVREFQASTCYRPIAEAFFEQIVAESLKVPARVWKATAAAWFREERWAEPERVRMPVAIMWGDQDAYFPREYQDALIAVLPHARFTVYEGTGHAPHWEEPERFARELQSFISGARPAPAQ